MSLHKKLVVLKTVKKLESMPIVGEGKIKISDVAFWSGMHRQTTYRYLRDLERMGLLKKVVEPFKNTVVHFWSTTQMGKEALAIKEMF
jgi:DNA-binding IclR family transcriptional regulator